MGVYKHGRLTEQVRIYIRTRFHTEHLAFDQVQHTLPCTLRDASKPYTTAQPRTTLHHRALALRQ